MEFICQPDCELSTIVFECDQDCQNFAKENSLYDNDNMRNVH